MQPPNIETGSRTTNKKRWRRLEKRTDDMLLNPGHWIPTESSSQMQHQVEQGLGSLDSTSTHSMDIHPNLPRGTSVRIEEILDEAVIAHQQFQQGGRFPFSGNQGAVLLNGVLSHQTWPQDRLNP